MFFVVASKIAFSRLGLLDNVLILKSTAGACVLVKITIIQNKKCKIGIFPRLS